MSKTKRQPIREIIGRVATAFGLYGQNSTISVDATRPDAAFWDALRYGGKKDYDLGGLFAEPIAATLSSWVLGKGLIFEAEGSEETTVALNQMVANNMQKLIETYEDSVALGNGYTIIELDGTLTRVPPDQVTLNATPAGSLNVTSITINTKLTEESLIDEYSPEERILTTEKGTDKKTERFPNQIGMIPIIHWPMKRAANELYGRPYFARLLPLFGRYNKVLTKSLDGAELMGNPIPVIEGVENATDTLNAMKTGEETVTDSTTGQTSKRPKVDFSKLSMVIVGKGGSFKFAGPQNGFTSDSGRLLEYLFLLMLQYSQIPEWVWGGAIASSKASVDAQFPAFANLIDGLRLKLEVVLRELAKVYLATIALYTPGIDLEAPIILKWPKVITDDRSTTLEYIKYAADKGWVTDETGLRLMQLVEDPQTEVEDARTEQEEFGDPYDQALDNFVKADAGDTEK